VKKRSKKSDTPSPYQLEKRLKKIVVTREVYTRSEHSPETPPRNFFDSVRLNRSATRRKVSAMNIPSPPPPSSRASTILQASEVNNMDGMQFCEDPRFRPWHRSLLAVGAPDTASIGAFENDIGARDRVPPYETVSRDLEPVFDDSVATGGHAPPTPPPKFRSSTESNSDDHKRLSCAPLQLQTAGLGRSASLLKARIAQKVWLGKSIKVQLASSQPERIVQIQETGRIAVPRKITIGRRLRPQKKSENLRVSDGAEEVTTQSQNTLRLVDADVEEPYSSSASRDPELTAMLHDPNQNRFSDSWEKFYEEQTQERLGEDPVDDEKLTKGAARLRTLSNSAMKRPPPNGAVSVAIAEDMPQGSAPHLVDQRMKPLPPTIRITGSGDEASKMIPPRPGPRTSSKGGIFAKFIGPGKIPPPVSPSISGACASNISKSRKASQSSVISGLENTLTPAHSTDTLAKIEVELQDSPTRSVVADIVRVPPRFTKHSSIDSGPSGSAPDRELPQLPEDGASERSRSRGSSHHRHSRKQSSISIGHVRNQLSASSITTVRPINKSRIGPAGGHALDHAWSSNSHAPQRTSHRQNIGQAPFDHPTMERSESVRPGTTSHGYEYSFPASTEAFLRKQAQKAARAESRRLIKQRDMASYGPIKEESEGDAVSPSIQAVDAIDQFPEPPCSRSGSRASTRHARSTQRSQRVSLGAHSRGNSNQVLSASRIVTVEDGGPVAPIHWTTQRSPSTKSRLSESRLPDGSSQPFRSKAKNALPKISSQRSLRSHTSQSALAVNGAHTPPSSDSCASDDELALSGLHRLELRREIQEIRALVILQGRTIEKLQDTVRLYMPTIRSRRSSRDLSLDRQHQMRLQLAPPSFPYPRGRVGVTGGGGGGGGTEPGPVIIGNVVVDSADSSQGFFYDGGGSSLDQRRLSGAPVTARMDSMVDQQFRRLG
jgi:hypothetical protein